MEGHLATSLRNGLQEPSCVAHLKITICSTGVKLHKAPSGSVLLAGVGPPGVHPWKPESRGLPTLPGPELTCALIQEVHGLLAGAEVARQGLLLGVLLHVGARVHRGVCAHGGAGHIRQGDPAAGAPAQHGLAHQDLGGRRHVEVELDLLLLVYPGGAGAGVAGVEQHLVLAVGRVGRPERRVVKNPKLPANVLHVHLHLLHCTVEDAFSLFHRKRNFFRHEVAIIYRNPGPRRAKEKREVKSTLGISKIFLFNFFFHKRHCGKNTGREFYPLNKYGNGQHRTADYRHQAAQQAGLWCIHPVSSKLYAC